MSTDILTVLHREGSSFFANVQQARIACLVGVIIIQFDNFVFKKPPKLGQNAQSSAVSIFCHYLGVQKFDTHVLRHNN